ncbi:MAG: radical SAM protein [Atopobiaceae bacterium]|nr:radical SAM protein [Atopobiaceae bacterium]
MERLDGLQKALFEAAPSLPADSPIVRRWQKAGFLRHTDEVAYLRDLVRERVRDLACGDGPRPLVLTIGLTNRCNFACPYCFQNNLGYGMSVEVQDAIVDLVTERLATGGYDKLEISWFGGEPLLEMGAIERMSERLIPLADAHGIPYKAMIHTNGYLLDQSAADLLEHCRVRNVLVTLDGLRETNDATRRPKVGGGSFDRIVRNLTTIRTDMKIIVRCNLHKGNIDELDDLKGLVNDIARSSGNNIRLRPAAVRLTPASKERFDKTEAVSDDQFAKVASDFGISERRQKFLPTLVPCPVMRLNELYVDADGSIFPNCNFEATVPARALGNVLDGDPLDWEALAELVFERYSFPDGHPECLACKKLVCCYGGCAAWRLDRGYHHCPELLDDPDGFVLRCYYASAQGRTEASTSC